MLAWENTTDKSHPLDQHLSHLLQRLAEPQDAEKVDAQTTDLTRLVEYVSAQTREGVIAAPLDTLEKDGGPLDRQALLASSVVGEPGSRKPLIMDATHAWLYRYWDYECRLARCLSQRLMPLGGEPEIPPDPDWQQIAAERALKGHFLIISGGPGTGKTTTITRILARLLEQTDVNPKRILLAAPTGKAAMRMQEAIRSAKQRLDCSEALKARIPEQTSTLHRLLGYIPNRIGFRHHTDHPLPADVVIVDEASMIDVSLLTHLLEAVSPAARIILLGDKNQLAAVETGSIFRDLCNAGENSPLRRHIVILEKSYRFAEEGGIGQLANAIRHNQAEKMLQILQKGHGIHWSKDTKKLQTQNLLQYWQAYFSALQTHDKTAIFRAFEQFRILTPLRKGNLGTEGLNHKLDILMHRLKGNANAGFPWYAGRPVMITQNDYRQALFNGDIGITLPEPDGQFRVWFPNEEENGFRAFSPVRLPAHESAWALTVHKSQGSEFQHVFLILPEVANSPLLGRELLYTAATRARQTLTLAGAEGILLQTLRQVHPASSMVTEKVENSCQLS